MSDYPKFHEYNEDDPHTGTNVSQPDYPHYQNDQTSNRPHKDLQQYNTAYGSYYSGSVSNAAHSQLPYQARRAYAMDQSRTVECETTSYAPQSGAAGTVIAIESRWSQPLSLQASAYMNVEGKHGGAIIMRHSTNGHSHDYTIEAQVPRLDPTAMARAVYPLLHVVDGTSQFDLYIGEFQYGAGSLPQQVSSVDVPMRKRRISISADADASGPVKKTSSQQLQALAGEHLYHGSITRSPAAAQIGYRQHGGSTHDFHAQGGGTTLTSTPQFGSIATSQREQRDIRLQRMPIAGSATTDVMPQSAGGSKKRGKTPPTSVLPGPENVVARATALRTRLMATTESSSNPTLMRSSTLPTTTSGDYELPGPTQTFNPYTIYANNKAFLELVGDLDTMAEGWTDEEARVKRRIVEFTREQDGNHVTASFQPVTLEARTPNSICVSCIWWEEKNETFITSVDTIQLLESLVAVRFTVEEKNRIRRNLEGYKPWTVSKGKVDSENFFKFIMDFPNPKPRNIEKDVKVFEWKILKHALHKIMGKYSASYASTAARIPQANERPVHSATSELAPYPHGTERPNSATPSNPTPPLSATTSASLPLLTQLQRPNFPFRSPTPRTQAISSYASASASASASSAVDRHNQSIPLFSMPPAQPTDSPRPPSSTYQERQPLFPTLTPTTMNPAYSWTPSHPAQRPLQAPAQMYPGQTLVQRGSQFDLPYTSIGRGMSPASPRKQPQPEVDDERARHVDMQQQQKPSYKNRSPRQ